MAETSRAPFAMIGLTVFLFLVGLPASVAKMRPNGLSSLPGVDPLVSKDSTHTSTHAIILSSSVFYHNYRHTSNALAIYDILKNHPTHPIPDENIILMLAEDAACDSRNPIKNAIHPRGKENENVYLSPSDGGTVEVDYRGADVNPENVRRVMTGRHKGGTLRGQKLNLDRGSNLLIYFTGHGGNGFFKFRDQEEMMTADLVKIIREMDALGRYDSILFIADTCQAFTLLDGKEDLKRVISVGSSLKDENSYSYGVDNDLGISSVDRFTRYLVYVLLSGVMATVTTDLKQIGLNDVFKRFSYNALHSNVGIGASDDVDLGKVSIGDFFQGAKRERMEMVLEKADWVGGQKKDTDKLNAWNQNIPEYDPPHGKYDQYQYDEEIRGMALTDPMFILYGSILIASLVISTIMW